MKYGNIDINEFDIINTIMNNSQDTFYFKDKFSRILFSSRAHSLLWGVDDPEMVIGKSDFDYFPRDFAQQAYDIEQEIMATEIPILS
jgi:hypothetical protein